MTGLALVQEDAPRWTRVAEVLQVADYDETITYVTLADVLGLVIPLQLERVQSLTREASRHVLRTHRRAIEAVPRVGYRIVRPREQLRLAHGHQTRAQNQLTKGTDVVTFVDRGQLEPGECSALDAVVLSLAAQAVFMHRMDVRQSDLERSLASMRTQTASDADEMRERLLKAEQAITAIRTEQGT